MDGPFVTFQGGRRFPDGTVVPTWSTLRFRGRDELWSSLTASGFRVDEVRDAPQPTRTRTRLRCEPGGWAAGSPGRLTRIPVWRARLRAGSPWTPALFADRIRPRARLPRSGVAPMNPVAAPPGRTEAQNDAVRSLIVDLVHQEFLRATSRAYKKP